MRISEEERQIRESITTGRDFEADVYPLTKDRSAKVANPIPSAELGPYLRPRARYAVTTDVRLLKAFQRRFKRRLPGFLAAGPRRTLHFDPVAVRVALVTCGGVCPGVNTVIDQIVRRHDLYYQHASRGRHAGRASILGFLNGFRGFIDGKWVMLTPEVTESWPRRGGSKLRQLREREDSRPDPIRIVEALQKYAIDIVYIVGGDGTVQTASQVQTILASRGGNTAVAHIPKTMDNDIPWISESFGFETAIAEAARLVNAIRDEAESNNRIGIVEVMGAGMGHTAAYTALASGEIDVVLIPEEGDISIAAVLDHLDRHALGPGRKGYAVILASERKPPLHSLNLDNPGESELIKKLEERFPMEHVKSRVFVNQPRHFIRAVPANCQDQLYCRQLANCAVDSALAGYTGFSISKWVDSYVMVPFVRISGHRKHLPLDSMVWKQVMNLTGQPQFGSN